MPNSLQSSAIASPASRRATNCSLSSITEHSFQGIITPSPEGESVTYVSGTMCYLCLRPLINHLHDLILLQIGSIGSNIGLKQPDFRRYLFTKLRSYVRVAGCRPQTGMPNPLFHQIAGYTVFLKDGHP